MILLRVHDDMCMCVNILRIVDTQFVDTPECATDAGNSADNVGCLSASNQSEPDGGDRASHDPVDIPVWQA